MSWRADISRNVNALRIFFDASNARAAGLRSFVEKNFAELKGLSSSSALCAIRRFIDLLVVVAACACVLLLFFFDFFFDFFFSSSSLES
jgi:hypothetical protein